MKTLYKLAVHATIILSALFLTLFIIDRFNPAMEFLDSDVTDWFLGAFCICALTSSVITAIQVHKK